MGEITPINHHDQASQGLTCIPRRIHCAATPDAETPDYTEAELVMVDNFIKTLAEVAITAATRKRSERSE